MLPIQKNTKIPIKQWKQDGQVVDFANQDFINCDVGLCPLPGYIAIDVDTKDGKDGLASLDLLGLSVGETLTQTTPSGGYHLIYKINPNIELKSTVSTLDGIDLRTANQGYIKLYSDWLDYEEDEITIDAIIELPSSAIKMLLDAQKETKTRVKNTIQTGDLITSDRNSTLTSIAGGLWAQGEDFEVFSDKIHAINSKRCMPCLEAKEVDTIINSIAGYARDDKVDTAGIDKLTNTLITNFLMQKEKEALSEKEHVLPQLAYNLTGIMKLVFDAINESSRYYNPHLALGATIALMGGICSAKYRSPTGMKTNVFVIGLANAGIGKDAGLDAIAKIMGSHEQGKKILGGSKIKSDSGLYAALKENNQKLYALDEFGKILDAMTNRRAEERYKSLSTAITELYSQKTFLGADAATKENSLDAIENPCLSIYGVSNPDTYYNAISDTNIKDGLLPRYLVLDDYDRPVVRNKKPPNLMSFTDMIKSVHDLIYHTKHIRSDDIKTYLDDVIEVKYLDQKADDAFESYCDFADSFKRKNAIKAGLWSRSIDYVAKLSALYAISENYRDPKVSSQHIMWAAEIVNYCQKGIEIRLNSANTTEYGQKKQKVLDYINDQGELTKKQIGTASFARNWTPEDRDKILNDLEENGLIKSRLGESKGRKPKIYSAV